MDDQKNIEPIYTLSIASKLSEIPSHSIRQYIERGLIIPFKTSGNRHLFSEVDILRLKCIKKSLTEDGINIAGIKSMFALIPCWVLKPCRASDRENCEAYHSTNKPCWEASGKSELCMTTDCRTCTVYRFPETCKDLKSLLKKLT
ncbi:MAG TPA: MerR family transcriptional regulator [Bacteroidales bacterium]|nr:MerR family transcriptional regulator [Bacteroidales bacterium]